MATLTGKQIKDTYDSVLKLQDNAALSSSLKTITDGLGNATGLSLSDTEVKSTVDVEASGFKTPTGTSSQYLMADGSVGTNAGDLNFIHNQGVASASWSITHNLNKFPDLQGSCDIKKKNPAYRRHRISRPMLIEAPIQKKT